MDNNTDKKGPARRPQKIIAGIIRTAGTLVLAALVIACAPLTVPRLVGYQIYSVVSGSMEPAISLGSIVYVKAVEPAGLETDDVIAFYGARDSASIITHRIVENRVLMGEFITKGDANQTEDMNPVPYANYIGKVTRSVPRLGKLAEIFTSQTGKIAAGGMIGAAILLHILASLLEWEPKRR